MFYAVIDVGHSDGSAAPTAATAATTEQSSFAEWLHYTVMNRYILTFYHLYNVQNNLLCTICHTKLPWHKCNLLIFLVLEPSAKVLSLQAMVIGCCKGVYVLGQRQFKPPPTAAQFLSARRCFRLPRELRANSHYLHKYSPWSTKFTEPLQSRIFWRGALYATVFFGGITSYFYYVSA